MTVMFSSVTTLTVAFQPAHLLELRCMKATDSAPSLVPEV